MVQAATFFRLLGLLWTPGKKALYCTCTHSVLLCMLALAFALLPLLVGRPGQSLCLGIYCGLILWGEALLLSLAGGPANNMVWSHGPRPLVYRAACA